jgi:hypothetical protein
MGLRATKLEPLKCDWCEYEAVYSINWECGHASAMCVLCFEPSDARDWTMDIMEWDAEPAICPDCAG